VIVHVGSILHGYTGDRSQVEAEGGTLGALLADLDRRYPGIRFRIVDEQERVRPHVRIFVGARQERSLGRTLRRGDEIHILGALSGG
jgi:molybdopterin converting factor small subunit